MRKTVTILFACTLPLFGAEKPEVTIWVTRAFIGGPKCASSGPVSHYTAPGFESERARFIKLKIRLLREYFRDLATCQACHTCPNYHREIFFEIHEKDLSESEKLGYRRAAPAPDAEELREFEENKRYRPKPDRPPED